MLLIDEILRAHPSLEPSFSAFGFTRSPHLVSAGGDEVRAPVDEVRRTQRSPRNEEREEDLSESDLPFMFIQIRSNGLELVRQDTCLFMGGLESSPHTC